HPGHQAAGPRARRDSLRISRGAGAARARGPLLQADRIDARRSHRHGDVAPRARAPPAAAGVPPPRRGTPAGIFVGAARPSGYEPPRGTFTMPQLKTVDRIALAAMLVTALSIPLAGHAAPDARNRASHAVLQDDTFQAIAPGMGVDEVVALIGQPARKERFERSHATAWDYP